MALHISRSTLDQLRRHGEEEYPHECCGILVGTFAEDGRHVLSTVRCRNARMDDAHNRYQIDPRDLFRVQREAASAGLEIVGFYHSHPDHPANWSQTDLEEAYWTGCSYVITCVAEGKAAATRSFLLMGGEEARQFEDEAILEMD